MAILSRLLRISFSRLSPIKVSIERCVKYSLEAFKYEMQTKEGSPLSEADYKAALKGHNSDELRVRFPRYVFDTRHVAKSFVDSF